MDGHHQLVEMLEQEVDSAVGARALTLRFTDFTSWGMSSDLEARKAENFPTVGSEEEAPM